MNWFVNNFTAYSRLECELDPWFVRNYRNYILFIALRQATKMTMDHQPVRIKIPNLTPEATSLPVSVMPDSPRAHYLRLLTARVWAHHTLDILLLSTQSWNQAQILLWISKPWELVLVGKIYLPLNPLQTDFSLNPRLWRCFHIYCLIDLPVN